jgi:Flp pilus assembly pilin Flp
MQTITHRAQDKSLELAVRAQYALVELLARMEERLRDEEGQTAVEYAGILAFVGILFLALFKARIADHVTTWAGNVVKDIGKGVGGK